MKSANIAYFGTPQFAVYVLEELEKAGVTPAIVVTQPDRPKGRGLAMTPPPVKEWALDHDIPVIQPSRLSSHAGESQKLTQADADSDMLWNSEWDLFIVAAYGKIIPHDLLSLPRAGSLNVHPSLLPKYRGPSPIESQILADDKETGVSIMVLDDAVDHGPLVAQASITPEEWPLRARVLEELLAREGGRLMAEVIPLWIGNATNADDSQERNPDTLTAEPQKHSLATFTEKIEKEDGLVDLSGDAYQNYLKFCAYEEWPGTYFFVERNGKRVRVNIIDASFENGAFTIKRVTPEGKREMDYQDFVRGS